VIYVTHGMSIAAICAAPFLAYWVLGKLEVRLRLARHRRLTRKHGQMLRRITGGAR